MNKFRILDDILTESQTSCSGIVIRHSEEQFFQGDIGKQLEVPLSMKGLNKAKKLGAMISYKQPIVIITSPFPRCIQTADYLMKGLKKNVKLCESTMLGKHGPYVINPKRTAELMTDHGHNFITLWFKGKFTPNIMLSPKEGTNKFIIWLLEDIIKKYNHHFCIIISHGLIVTTIISSVFKKYIPADNYIGFLDGFYFSYEKGHLTFTYCGETKEITLNSTKIKTKIH